MRHWLSATVNRGQLQLQLRSLPGMECGSFDTKRCACFPTKVYKVAACVLRAYCSLQAVKLPTKLTLGTHIFGDGRQDQHASTHPCVAPPALPGGPAQVAVEQPLEVGITQEVAVVEGKPHLGQR